jgi:hypothetical protein
VTLAFRWNRYQRICGDFVSVRILRFSHIPAGVMAVEARVRGPGAIPGSLASLCRYRSINGCIDSYQGVATTVLK